MRAVSPWSAFWPPPSPSFFALRIPLSLGELGFHPLGQDRAALADRVGGSGLILGVVEGGNLASRTRFLDAWAQALRIERERQIEVGRDPFLRYSLYRLPLEFFEDRRLLYLQTGDLLDIETRLSRRIAQERLKRNPFYVSLDLEDEPDVDVSFRDLREKYGVERFKEYAATDDDNTLGIIFKPQNPKDDRDRAELIVASVRAEADRLLRSGDYPGVNYALSGSVIEASERHDLLDDGLFAALLIAFVGLTLLALLLLRWFRLVAAFWAAVLAPLLVGLAWGATWATSFNLTALLALPCALTLGSGAVLCLLYHYRNARKRDLDGDAAILETLSTEGRYLWPALLAAAATAFLIARIDIAEFRAFGLLLGGMLLLFLPTIGILLPALVLTLEHAQGMVFAEQVWWPASEPMGLPRRRTILAIGLSAAALGLLLLAISYNCWQEPWSGPKHRCVLGSPCCRQPVAFDYDFRSLWAKPQESVEARDKFRQIVPLPEDVVYVAAPDKKTLTRFLDDLDNARKGLDSTVFGQSSIFTFLPQKQEAKLEIIERIAHLASKENLGLFDSGVKKRIDELTPILHPPLISIYQLPTSVIRAFTQELPGTDGLLEILAAALGNLGTVPSREEWNQAVGRALDNLSPKTIERLLSALANGELGGDAHKNLANLSDGKRKALLLQSLYDFSERNVGTVGYVYPQVDTLNGMAGWTFKTELERVARHHPNIKLGGLGLDLATSLRLLQKAWWQVLLLCLVLVFALALLATRSLRLATHAFCLLALGLLWVLFSLAVFDVKWSLYSLLALPLAAFAALAVALRLGHSYAALGQPGVVPALRLAIPDVVILLLSAAITLSGFMALEEPGLALLARLALVGVMLVSLAGLTVLPALLETLAKRRI